MTVSSMDVQVVRAEPAASAMAAAAGDQSPTEAFAPSTSGAQQPPPSLSITGPVANLLRPPAREERTLASLSGRNTLPYEDSGDDGIVPSTPVLLRPRTNDGFAEAVISPQVNTRFIFGSIPDLSVVPSIGTQQDLVSHLESQGDLFFIFNARLFFF